MDYPAWILSKGIGAGWVIGLIATFHVLVSHFAVGGGIFMPFTEAWARKNNREDVIDFLKKFSKFFLILTNTFGAITGIGIWFAIGLVSPQASASLIRLFTFVWATEWAVFLVEIISLIFYYYGWDKMKPHVHQTIGWIYAITSWLSLFTINGILTFMLTPGGWTKSHSLFEGFFNPAFWPALIIRTLVCIALAGIYATFVISKMDENSKFRKELLAYVSTWMIPAYILLAGALIWYFTVLPPQVIENLLSGVAGGVGAASKGTMAVVSRISLLGLLVTVTTGLAFFVSAYLNPREFTSRKSLILLSSMAIFIFAYEDTREMLRKPFVIRDYMFSNGVLLEATTKKPLKRSFVAEMRFKPADSSVGEKMFVGQCMSCHTMKHGYRSLDKRLGDRKDAESIYQTISIMQKPNEENPYHKFMPPLIGTEEEVRALSNYIYTSLHPNEDGKNKESTESESAKPEIKPETNKQDSKSQIIPKKDSKSAVMILPTEKK